MDSLELTRVKFQSARSDDQSQVRDLLQRELALGREGLCSGLLCVLAQRSEPFLHMFKFYKMFLRSK